MSFYICVRIKCYVLFPIGHFYPSNRLSSSSFVRPNQRAHSYIHRKHIMYVQYKIMRVKHLALLFLTNIFIHWPYILVTITIENGNFIKQKKQQRYCLAISRWYEAENHVQAYAPWGAPLSGASLYMKKIAKA